MERLSEGGRAVEIHLAATSCLRPPPTCGKEPPNVGKAFILLP
jgi:hypothetical protein